MMPAKPRRGEHCPVCGATLRQRRSASDDRVVLVQCPRCGHMDWWEPKDAIVTSGTDEQEKQDFDFLMGIHEPHPGFRLV